VCRPLGRKAKFFPFFRVGGIRGMPTLVVPKGGDAAEAVADLDDVDAPPWGELASRQASWLNPGTLEDGDLYALEDRNSFSDDWRKVFVQVLARACVRACVRVCVVPVDRAARATVCPFARELMCTTCVVAQVCGDHVLIWFSDGQLVDEPEAFVPGGVQPCEGETGFTQEWEAGYYRVPPPPPPEDICEDGGTAEEAEDRRESEDEESGGTGRDSGAGCFPLAEGAAASEGPAPEEPLPVTEDALTLHARLFLPAPFANELRRATIVSVGNATGEEGDTRITVVFDAAPTDGDDPAIGQGRFYRFRVSEAFLRALSTKCFIAPEDDVPGLEQASFILNSVCNTKAEGYFYGLQQVEVDRGQYLCAPLAYRPVLGSTNPRFTSPIEPGTLVRITFPGGAVCTTGYCHLSFLMLQEGVQFRHFILLGNPQSLEASDVLVSRYRIHPLRSRSEGPLVRVIDGAARLPEDQLQRLEAGIPEFMATVTIASLKKKDKPPTVAPAPESEAGSDGGSALGSGKRTPKAISRFGQEGSSRLRPIATAEPEGPPLPVTSQNKIPADLTGYGQTKLEESPLPDLKQLCAWHQLSQKGGAKALARLLVGHKASISRLFKSGNLLSSLKLGDAPADAPASKVPKLGTAHRRPPPRPVHPVSDGDSESDDADDDDAASGSEAFGAELEEARRLNERLLKRLQKEADKSTALQAERDRLAKERLGLRKDLKDAERDGNSRAAEAQHFEGLHVSSERALQTSKEQMARLQQLKSRAGQGDASRAGQRGADSSSPGSGVPFRPAPLDSAPAHSPPAPGPSTRTGRTPGDVVQARERLYCLQRERSRERDREMDELRFANDRFRRKYPGWR
jgi:hypothetical protein